MPGVSGSELAEQLRGVCGEGTTLLAMSGSEVAQEKLGGYDGFLLKPFSADELKSACDQTTLQATADSGGETVILNEAVFENFARSMPAGQVFGLYKMCLDDSGRRLTAMRQAVETGDDAAYRRAAHAIKGGCGMVGAVELAKLAAEMENAGVPAEHDVTPLDHFLAASARLGRMLDSKARGMQTDATAVRP
jgi:HPt (histidine-containing phosphotransfer) domain-containing protein